ncbi:Inner membrane protein YqjA [Stieleria maiorica]|uniref:Inner membrane protein YqjA n=1 Tax=Stieleria maiorica TaxID=2795974 RepID=A0A5B9MAC3_9BACT|nr:DedA family protein [Stieleria maiorica]QEF96475.1 Inner membrane protein YqjA [Stieleria maiorica]
MNDWIHDILDQFGVVGVGVMMLVENIFPPIPSEVVMPWAGYAVSQGDLSFFGVVLAGSVGSFIGALAWYLFAKWLGRDRLTTWVERHGWWMTISSSEIEQMDMWFARWGHWAVFLCRMIPGLRTLISIPAGFAAMPAGKFCVYTAIGTILWTALLAALGWWLADRYEQLVAPLSWVSTAVIAGMFFWWLFRFVKAGLIRNAANS